ncbi:hypothetical protein ACIQCF_20995 [Streptomyces sp. NPDC088353]|uniref:hypothetical protein n=1 Tax=unclassified Streptomyces TaxID=2593676 RepID=UPI003673C44C
MDELFQTMRTAGHDPYLVRSERALWKLYLEDAQHGSLGYDGHHDWSVVQGRYTLCVSFEFAATLDLVDVQYIDPDGARDDFDHMWGSDWLQRLSRNDRKLAIRLTRSGLTRQGAPTTTGRVR